MTGAQVSDSVLEQIRLNLVNLVDLGAGGGVSTHHALTDLGLQLDDHPQYQLRTEIGAANGYAGLGAGSLVPVAQLGTGVSVTTKYLRGDQTWQTLPAQDFAYASLTGKPDLTIYPLLDGTRPYVGNLQAPTISVGGAPITGPLLSIPVAPTGSANYGLLSIGNGPFDGSTSGFFVGNSNGTGLAMNFAAGFTGRAQDIQIGGVRMFGVGRPTQASGASATLNAIDLPSFTVTVTGSTNITTAAGFAYMRIGAPVYTSASPVVVTNAPTLALEGPPSGAGSLTITNPYTLWSQAGANRFDGRVIGTVNGAASAPGLLLSGTPFAGTGTTSFPLLYINDSTATASSTLSTAGTYLGVNGHGTADLANLMLDGVSKLKVTSAGILQTAQNGLSPSFTFVGATAFGLGMRNGSNMLLFGGENTANITTSSFAFKNTVVLSWLAGDPSGSPPDLSLQRLAAASLQLGAANNASPVAYTITIGESSRPTIDSNVAGASGTLQPGRGTGTGATVPLILNAPIQVASGTGAQTQTEFMRGQAVGTAIGIGFLGAAASPRILMATGAAHTVDDLITAFQTYGLFRQS